MSNYPFIFGARGGGGSGGSVPSVSLGVSDTTPDFGQTITLTASPTNITPTSYIFFIYDGSTIELIIEQAGAVYNWATNRSGTYDVYVLATDGTNNVYALSEITVALDPDAAAFLIATGITDPIIQSAIEELVGGLKGFSIWSKCKAFYPLAGATATNQKFNLKDPRDLDAAYRLLFFGGITQNSNGITGNGINAYAQTNFIPLGNLGLNSSGLTWYSRTNFVAGGDSFPFAAYSGNGLGVDYNGTTVAFPMNNETSFDDFPHLRNGVISVNRTVSTTRDLWRDGVKISAFARNTVNLPTSRIGILATGTPQYYTTANIATAVIHDGMSDSDMVNLHSVIQTFNTALSR